MRAPDLYFSAEQLKISEAENNALAEVQRLLETGELTHMPTYDEPRGNMFNMNISLVEDRCGSLGCIGGWMWILMGKKRPQGYEDAGDYVAFHPQLVALFYPLQDCASYTNITTAQAAYAIKRFRQTGDAGAAWQEALQDG